MIGSIYKLSCNISGKSYVGSTRQPLNKRLQGHISSYRKGQNMASAQIIANGDYKIEELECVECDDPRELLKREQYHMDQNDCCNYKRAFLLPEQRYRYPRLSPEEKHEFLERKKQLDKESYQDCICGSRFNRSHKTRHFRTQKHKDAVNAIKNNLCHYIIDEN